MIYTIVAIIALIVGFVFGRIYQWNKDEHPEDFIKDYSWNTDESLIEGLRWMMEKPDATLEDIHNWCCDRSRWHMLWEPWRCNPRLLNYIRHWQKEDQRRAAEKLEQQNRDELRHLQIEDRRLAEKLEQAKDEQHYTTND